MSGESHTIGDLNILVIDDSAFIRGMMGRHLKGLGATKVSFAANGHEAMAVMLRDEARIDVVFCDIQMPDMDGIELIRHAVKLAPSPAFVFVSDSLDSMILATANLARIRGIHVLGTIRKPVSRRAVKDILDRLGVAQTPVERPAHPRKSDLTSVDLRTALANGEFELHYQPKKNLRTNEIDGYEALVRWQHPAHGIIMPDFFIAEAERTGLIDGLTAWVLAAALDQVSTWRAAGLNTKISVNLSAHNLIDLSLPDRIAMLAARAGVEPSQLVLEITESGAFGNVADAIDTLVRLHLKGFQLSIDDFGTGYSSMEQLRRVPFSELKIDRAFVHNCAQDQRVRAILESSAQLARRLDMSIVAEGAEASDEVEILENLGIDMVQGYYIAKPMTACQALTWAPARKTRREFIARPVLVAS